MTTKKFLVELDVPSGVEDKEITFCIKGCLQNLYYWLKNHRQACEMGKYAHKIKVEPIFEEERRKDSKSEIRSISKVLIEKLPPEELHELCEAFDNGKLDYLFEMELIPKDAENFPNLYK